MIKEIVNIIEPNTDNKWSRIYEWIMLVAIAIGIFPLMFRTHYTLFWFFDIISCVCFVVDYLLRWITVRTRSEKKQWTAFVVYPFTPMAIIDLLSILPTVSSEKEDATIVYRLHSHSQ